MKRRNFLKGLLAAPAIGAVVSRETVAEPVRDLSAAQWARSPIPDADLAIEQNGRFIRVTVTTCSSANCTIEVGYVGLNDMSEGQVIDIAKLSAGDTVNKVAIGPIS